VRRLNLNRKWKIVFLVLLIATITVQGYSTYIYAYSEKTITIPDDWSEDTCYIACPLNYTPEKYWILTEPDQYILEAINYPENWTEPFYACYSTFWDKSVAALTKGVDVPTPMAELPEVPFYPFLYNGTYYAFDVALPGTRVTVKLLTEEPEEYCNLTKPERWLLKAIENPGKGATVPIDDYHYPPQRYFKYEGKYYSWQRWGIDYWPDVWGNIKGDVPIRTAIGLSLIWVVAGSVYLVKNRKTKAEP
jgi:hypothetical protein